MFVACYIIIMLFAVVATIVFGVSNGLTAWQTTMMAGAALAAGQIALLVLIVIRLAFTRPVSEAPPDSRQADPSGTNSRQYDRRP